MKMKFRSPLVIISWLLTEIGITLVVNINNKINVMNDAMCSMIADRQ